MYFNTLHLHYYICLNLPLATNLQKPVPPRPIPALPGAATAITIAIPTLLVIAFVFVTATAIWWWRRRSQGVDLQGVRGSDAFESVAVRICTMFIDNLL